MTIIKKSWPEFKDILRFNNLYFDYEDIGGVRNLFCQRNANITYTCKFPIVENPSEDSDQYDFETSWADKAGEKKYVYYSQSFTVTTEVTEFDFKIKANDETTDVEAFLYKGLVSVDGNAVRGDYISVAVVDIDNILGLGAGAILGYVIRKKILHGGEQVVIFNPPKYDFLSSKRKILAGLYLRIKYVGTGLPNIIADYEYEY